MASAEISQYHKYIDLQNVSGSGDPASAPVGGVFLFASGSSGSAKLYLQNEGVGTPLSLADAGTLQLSDGSSTDSVNLSGDTLTVTGSGGAATVAVTDNTITIGFDINNLSPLGGTGLAQSDKFAFSDGGTEKYVTFSNLEDAIFANMNSESSDVAVAAGGAISLADDSVDSAEIADGAIDTAHIADDQVTNAKLANIARGSVKVGGASNAPTDLDAKTSGQILVGDGTDINSVAVSGDVTLAANGAVSIGNQKVTNAMLADDAVGADELAANAVVNASVASGAAIAASKLDFNVDLGGNVTFGSQSDDTVTFTGPTSHSHLTASHARITNLDVVTINSINQTETTLEVKDKLIVAALSASSANSDGGGLRIGGGDGTTGYASVLWDHSNQALDFSISGSGGNGTQLQLRDGVLRPESDSDVDLGADGVAYKKLYVDDIDLNGQGRVDLDADADTSIRSSADDQIDFEVGGSDLVAIKSTGIHLVDDKKLVFGSNDDASFEYDEDGNDVLLYAGANMRFGDDIKLEFGSGGDASIEYDENGSDELKFAGAAVAFSQAVSMDGNVTLGSNAIDVVSVPGQLSASAGLLIPDDKKLEFGTGKDASFEYDEDGNDVLLYAGANMRFGDDIKLEFGASGDAGIEYDEDGTDQLRIHAPAAGVVIAGTTPSLTIGDAGAEDTKLVFDGNAQDFYMGLDDSADKLLIGLGSTVGTTPNLTLESASRDVTVHGDLTVAGDGIKHSGGNEMITLAANGVGFAGGYGGGGTSIGADGTINADSNLNLGADGSGADLIVYGGAANERMMYDASEHVLNFRNSSGATQLNIGGDASSEYAIDVANGSDNQNKIRAAAFVTYSDESLKSDVASMSNTALDTVMSLEGVEFTWKDSGERDFGFIAQDVQSVLPKAVHTAENGVQGVDYSRLTSVLVEAVKAQQVQIEDLKKTITNLKK